MSTTPMEVHVRARYDGRVFVPESPLDLPVGATLEGEVWRPGAGRPRTSEEWKAFVGRTAGAWEGFDEYEDPEDLPLDNGETDL